jgi:hypothetical protein
MDAITDKLSKLSVKSKKIKKKRKVDDPRAADLHFGASKEKEILPILNAYFKTECVPETYKFAIFDFVDDEKKVCIELKSRRICKRQYPDIMIGYNKVREGFRRIRRGYTVYLVWCFTDKLCYYELTRETFEKDWVKKNTCSRWDRIGNEITDLVYVPVGQLKNIKKLTQTAK